MGNHEDHHHSHENQMTLSFGEKAEKLLSHWIHHNEEHANSYRQWIGQFSQNDLTEVADLLVRAADSIAATNQILEQALSQVKSKFQDFNKA